MATIKYSLSITLLLISLCACAQKTEVRDLSSFEKISLSTAGVVYLTQGNNQKVVLKGSEEALDHIETEVKNGKLIITRRNKSWLNWSNNDDFEIHITMNKIKGLSISSSGRIYGQNKFKTEDMGLSVSGSGKMEIKTDSKDLDISISGSGRIEVAGTASEVEATVSGSGKIGGEDLKIRSCQVRISGSGSCTMYVEESIDARISGSGSVYYKGNPKNVNSSTSGSGRIKKI